MNYADKSRDNIRASLPIKSIKSSPISWRECGTGEPVIFLHAMTGSSTAWDSQITALSTDYRCIAWDMPGFGNSPPFKGNVNMQSIVTTLINFIINTLQIEKAHFVGHSVGGMIAQHLALLRPELMCSLTLIDTSPKFGLDGKTSPDEFAIPILQQLKSGITVERFSENMIRAIVNPACDQSTIDMAVQCMSRAKIEGLELTTKLIANHDVLQEIHNIHIPSMVIVGELDDQTPLEYSQRIADEILGSELKVVPNAGHLPNLETPETVNTLLKIFIDNN